MNTSVASTARWTSRIWAVTVARREASSMDAGSSARISSGAATRVRARATRWR